MLECDLHSTNNSGEGGVGDSSSSTSFAGSGSSEVLLTLQD